MSSSDRPTFLFSGRALPSDRDLERLTCAIRRAAEQRDFSPRTRDRYQAWILVFISWCLRKAPYRVRRSRIGSFRSALSNHPNTDSDEVCEAMDALSFLFGAVETIGDLFPDTSGHESQTACAVEGTNGHSAQPTHTAPAHQEDAISTIRLGWQAQEPLSAQTGNPPTPDELTTGNSLDLSDDVAERLRRLSVQLGLPPRVLASRAIDLVCEEIGGAEEHYTTKDLVQQYQTQIDLLHSVNDGGANGVDRDAAMPNCWDAVDEIINAGKQTQHSAATS